MGSDSVEGRESVTEIRGSGWGGGSGAGAGGGLEFSNQ